MTEIAIIIDFLNEKPQDMNKIALKSLSCFPTNTTEVKFSLRSTRALSINIYYFTFKLYLHRDFCSIIQGIPFLHNFL
jgi:hypothetical protein